GIRQHDVKPRPAELRHIVHPGTEQSVRSLRRRWFWTVSGTVVRTDAYTSIGGMHPHLLYAADNDFLCRFLLAGHSIVEVDWPVILKRYSTNSQTSRAVRSATDMLGWAYIMLKYLPYSTKCDRTLEYCTQLTRLARRTLTFIRRGDWVAVVAQVRG